MIAAGDFMPRYFFHFPDGKRRFTDSTGFELTGLPAASAHALVQARDLRSVLTEPRIQEWAAWKLIVTDTNQATVLELGFDLKSPTD